MNAAGARDVVDAIGHLTQRDGESYDAHIARIKAAGGNSGELAREVKRADLQHDLGREGIVQGAEREAHEQALKDLATEHKPITQRGEAENVGRQYKDAKGKLRAEKLDEAVVMARLEKLYQASVDSGAAEIELHWYHQAHDQIAQLAAKHHIDPTCLRPWWQPPRRSTDLLDAGRALRGKGRRKGGLRHAMWAMVRRL
jgi:hypothetical protein